MSAFPFVVVEQVRVVLYSTITSHCLIELHCNLDYKEEFLNGLRGSSPPVASPTCIKFMNECHVNMTPLWML